MDLSRLRVNQIRLDEEIAVNIGRPPAEKDCSMSGARLSLISSNPNFGKLHRPRLIGR